MLETGQRSPVVETVARLQRRIADGRIRPGERLIEERLAAELGLSRTPIREALITLSAQGHVVRTRRGWKALDFSRDELADAFELRAVLEGLAARHAAERGTPVERDLVVAAFEASHDAIEHSLTPGEPVPDTQIIGDTNSEFHRAVIAASGHRWVAAAVESVLVLPLVFNAPVLDTYEDTMRFDQFHGLITEAIVASEPGRAERLMTEHVYHARDAVLRYLEEHPD